MNNQINEEQYTTYCYDSIIHKISTIKDLEFKLIHKLYGLPTKNGKYSWNTIFDHKKVINNDKLFAFYENKSNFDFTSYLVGKRHLSSHEGKLSMRHFKDVSRLLFIRDISNNPLYKEIPSGDYANGFYASLQIKNSRKEAIKYAKAFDELKDYEEHISILVEDNEYKKEKTSRGDNKSHLDIINELLSK